MEMPHPKRGRAEPRGCLHPLPRGGSAWLLHRGLVLAGSLLHGKPKPLRAPAAPLPSGSWGLDQEMRHKQR